MFYYINKSLIKRWFNLNESSKNVKEFKDNMIPCVRQNTIYRIASIALNFNVPLINVAFTMMAFFVSR